MLKYRYLPIDLAFRALSDSGHRAMVKRLSVGPASVSELAASLPTTLSAMLDSREQKASA